MKTSILIFAMMLAGYGCGQKPSFTDSASGLTGETPKSQRSEAAAVNEGSEAQSASGTAQSEDSRVKIVVAKGGEQNLDKRSDSEEADSSKAGNSRASERSATEMSKEHRNAKSSDDDNAKDGNSEGETAYGYCKRQLKVDGQRIVVAGKEQKVELNSGDVAFVKVVGNKNQVSIDLGGRGQEVESLKGLCIFAAGNMPKVDVKIQVNVEKIVYVGRGNQSAGAVSISEGRKISSFHADLAGNQTKLTVTGGCVTSKTVHGNGSEVICK